jgi:hypothetical protein
MDQRRVIDLDEIERKTVILKASLRYKRHLGNCRSCSDSDAGSSRSRTNSTPGSINNDEQPRRDSSTITSSRSRPSSSSPQIRATPGGVVRRLAFDRTLPPSEALGRIGDAYRDYDNRRQS